MRSEKVERFMDHADDCKKPETLEYQTNGGDWAIAVAKYIVELENTNESMARIESRLTLVHNVSSKENAALHDKIAELEKRLIAPTDNGVVALDSICEKFNANEEFTLNKLVCEVWNKAYSEALKEGRSC
jgi:hypothetical protein